MVGVTLYVSITTEESVKIDQGHWVIKGVYGYSFLCAVVSFVLQELTGVLTVYWFIYRFRALVRKQEKLRERTRQLMGDCLSMTTALPLNLAAINTNNNYTKSPVNRSNYQLTANHYPTSDNQRYLSNFHVQKPPIIPQRRRIPFDKSVSSTFQSAEPHSFSVFPPRSPTLLYGDYCRVLIRTEDMDLLTQMVKSRSQGQSLANSRPTTPAMINAVKSIPNSHPPPPPPPPQPTTDRTTRRNTRKGVKRTTSV